jgi:hypothetical protein
MRWLLGAFLALWAGAALAQPTGPAETTPGVPYTGFLLGSYVPGSAGPVVGQPTALAINSPDWTSSTDLTPVSQFVNGWTAALTLNATAPVGNTSAYNLGSYASPNLSFTDTSPGYNSSASPTTVARTIVATSWLRRTYNNAALPTEAANSGNARVSLSLSDFVYATDTLSAANAVAGLYTGSLANAAIPVTNNSTRAYPRPICAWVTPPGGRVGTGGSLTVEMFCGHAYAQGGQPVAAINFTLSDGTHTVSHTVSTLTASAIQFSTSCAATNGSPTLTSCGSTVGLQVGERMNVPGIPGQPKILSFTSSSITFGQTTTCTPTLLGSETISTTPGVGEGLADGGFAGATITDAHLTGSPVALVAPVGAGSTVGSSVTLTVGAPASGQWAAGMSITGTNIPAGDYISALGTSTGGAGTVTLHAASSGTVSGSVTGSVLGANPGGATVTTVRLSTAAAIGVASSGACTINHIYQGATGAVTATLGNPVPVYSATFSSSDFSTINQGAVSVRAQVYPNVGDVVLDTQTGADGTGCDWFYIYDTGSGGAGVCDSGNAAFFATTGLNVSPNLHNLWAYYDKDNSYAPAYVWASGSAGGTPAVQSTSADPGSAAYYASAFAALANIKTVMNARTTAHNDINGVVFCYVATGSPYLGFGGAISTSVTAAKPGVTVTSATIGQACPANGSINANQAVTFGHSATTANLNPGTWARLNNLTISDTAAVFEGSDGANHTSFPTDEFVFSNDKFSAGGSPILFQIGISDVYSSYADESAHEGDIFTPFSTTTVANRAFFNTIAGGSFTAKVATHTLWTSLGNDEWGAQPLPPTSNANAVSSPQAISIVNGFNRYLGMFQSSLQGPSQSSPLNNVLDVNNIYECMNQAGQSPCVQISADSNNVPASNVVRQYDGVAGARTNIAYLEGLPITPAVVASGGSLAAGTYFAQTGYALKGNPTVETSTDGPTTSITVGGTGTDSLSFVLPCDPNYVFYLYIDTTNPPAHSATVGGVAATQLAGCQTAVATAIGTSRTPPTVAGTTGHNEFKTAIFQRFTIDNNFNMKNDTYGGSGATASGGRVGNWEARWKVGWLGNVAVTGTQINGPGYGPLTGLGEVGAYLDTYNPANSNTDISWVLYNSDRSFGGFAATPVSPALNIGEGDYCPANSTNVGSRVPSGSAAYPWDINGTTRKNDGTGYAGAYEGGCQ